MSLQQINTQDLVENLLTNIKEPIPEKKLVPRTQEEWDKFLKEKQAEQKKQQEISRLGGLLSYEEYTRDKFDNKAILDALSGFPEENYFLWGPAGTGKTHAATAVLRETPNAYVIRMSRISRWLRRCDGPDEEIDVIKKLSNISMLLDDLGSEKMTEFLQSNFYEIIDRRVEYRVNGLIITSNLSLDQLAPIIGDRTVSRIMWLVGKKNILEFSGKDYRWQK